MERARNFCFTINFDGADTWDDVERLFPGMEQATKDWDCKYLIFGREKGKESQILHLQGYVSFPNGKTLSALKKYNSRAHWEIARGTPKQASEYCEKEGAVFEKGVRPLSQAEKGIAGEARWSSVVKLARDGKINEILETDPQAYLQYHSAIDKISAKRKRTLDDMPEEFRVYWIWGPTNVGKSYEIRQLDPRPDEKNPKTKWWPPHYDGTAPILFDEVGKASSNMAEDFKIWFDRYVIRGAEFKFGQMDIRPTAVYATSNYHPRDIWPDEENYKALERRMIIIKKTMRGNVLPRANERSGSEASPPAAECLAASDPRDSNLCLRAPDPAGAERHAGGPESLGDPDLDDQAHFDKYGHFLLA